ncbi:hypothetical protein GCM10023175_41120 [Pseudonocardia xishanensis]|uniref:Transposase IS4-like domain-containing protein n=1 Tax=Pseudonocardia xishanensis TaxID=630995 RepID=A0ABP8RW36_9PSEU
MWHRLGIDTLLRRLAAGTRRDPVVERVLFALVANRALAPSSKLAATSWVAHDVHVPGLDTVSDDTGCRAMDWLIKVEDQLARGVFDAVAHLLNLEVDLIFFDTTSTYFETEEADTPVWRDGHGRVVALDRNRRHDGQPDAEDDGAADREPPAGATGQAGFRSRGKSKDSRDDLPQVVVGMAVTRDGIPVRVWCWWPGNTSDSPLIRQVKDGLRDWTLGKVIWVADRGFTSAANRRHLAAGGGGYILGEKLRSGSAEAAAAMTRQGRYQGANLRVKEVKISETERFVVCHNPEAADRDIAIRTNLVERLETMITGSDRLSAAERAELRGVISTKPGLNRFLRVTPGGLLRIDAVKITADARREVPAAHQRSAPVHRGHRAGLQAVVGGRARLARHEADPGPAPDLSPPRGPHTRPRRALLARAAPRPDRRDPSGHPRPARDPAARPRPAPTPTRRHLHRPSRAVPPDHPALPGGPAVAPGPRHRPAAADPRPRHRAHRTALTRHDAAA